MTNVGKAQEFKRSRVQRFKGLKVQKMLRNDSKKGQGQKWSDHRLSGRNLAALSIANRPYETLFVPAHD